MRTEVKVADAASQKQGRPCMEVALRLPSYPPTPPRSSVFVPRCLQAMERPGRPLFSLSGLIVVVPHVRSLCSTPGGGGGWGWGRGEFASQREAKRTREEVELHVPLVRPQGAGNRL